MEIYDVDVLVFELRKFFLQEIALEAEGQLELSIGDSHKARCSRVGMACASVGCAGAAMTIAKSAAAILSDFFINCCNK